MHMRINGFSISYTEQGNGIPLLLIHGFPLNKDMWAPQIQALSGVARVLAPDLRGHGDTRPTSGPSTMSLLANDMNAFLDKLSIRQSVVLCGLSMGGYIAFEFYRRFSQRVRGLILAATRAAADTPEGRRGRDTLAQQIKNSGIKFRHFFLIALKSPARPVQLQRSIMIRQLFMQQKIMPMC